MAALIEEFTFNEDNLKLSKEIIAKYPQGRERSAIMPLLHLAQQQNNGWISTTILDYIARLLNMPPIKVYEIATFYTMYNLKPVGRYHLQVCGTTPCWLRGAEKIIESCKNKLGINPGETTTDKLFTLTEVECLGGCTNAPVVQINNDYVEDLTVENFEKILDDLKLGKKIKIGSQIDRISSEPKGTKKL